ncbi:uncharacterized protein FOMMEDRAFT_156813 [Fomitiporia mediterranea MF3/22]|uniref:uncharacterized protein n=1 Tax=Fomitiporia mediterranea (strain MF3/22) TaxID=694068 RepID=UPI0004409954|nr:uncharacterized protein FOMMEDRAFT_156813 [Fomitiporia mediterranea MF3/22]EJD03409.1 hypothetical protein FOMMEDRAFT_156813 [Fomitiporia mediterranea MF3/22]
MSPLTDYDANDRIVYPSADRGSHWLNATRQGDTDSQGSRLRSHHVDCRVRETETASHPPNSGCHSLTHARFGRLPLLQQFVDIDSTGSNTSVTLIHVVVISASIPFKITLSIWLEIRAPPEAGEVDTTKSGVMGGERDMRRRVFPEPLFNHPPKNPLRKLSKAHAAQELS